MRSSDQNRINHVENVCSVAELMIGNVFFFFIMAPNYATFYHRSSFPEQSRYFVELQHKNKQGMNALAFEKKNILIILLTYSKKDESFDKSLHIKNT